MLLSVEPFEASKYGFSRLSAGICMDSNFMDVNPGFSGIGIYHYTGWSIFVVFGLL